MSQRIKRDRLPDQSDRGVENAVEHDGVADDETVRDRGPLTHSSFDDDDRIDRHPVP